MYTSFNIYVKYEEYDTSVSIRRTQGFVSVSELNQSSLDFVFPYETWGKQCFAWYPKMLTGSPQRLQGKLCV